MTKNTTASHVSGYRDCRGCREHSVNLHVALIESDFPSRADEIAEPHPDMNIKLTAFIVTQKLNFISYTRVIWKVLIMAI